MSNENQASAPVTLTDMDHSPAHCGMLVATVAVTVGTTSVEDGVLKVTVNAQGNTNHWFPIELSAVEAAKAQIEAIEADAVAKGRKSFRFQFAGPCETDYAPSVLDGNPDRQLSIHAAAATVRPVHPDPAKDPHTNTFFGFGQVQDKGWSLEFTHLDSAVENNKSPLQIKLSNQSQADLAHLKGKNVVVVGVLSRQQSLETKEDEGTTYNPYDHLSLSVSTAQECVPFAGKPRFNGNKSKQQSTISDYETGYADVDSNSAAAGLDDLPF